MNLLACGLHELRLHGDELSFRGFVFLISELGLLDKGLYSRGIIIIINFFYFLFWWGWGVAYLKINMSKMHIVS